MKPTQDPKSPDSVRKARLAEELRANLLKRKQQTRARRNGVAEDLATSGGEAEAEAAEGKPRD